MRNALYHDFFSRNIKICFKKRTSITLKLFLGGLGSDIGLP
jgi:hypothetical protein